MMNKTRNSEDAGVALKSSLTSKIEFFKELLDSRIRVEELFKEPKYRCQRALIRAHYFEGANNCRASILRRLPPESHKLAFFTAAADPRITGGDS